MKTHINAIAFLCHPYHRGGVTSWMANAANECARQKLSTYFITVIPRTPFISGKGRTTMVEMLSNNQSYLHLISKPVGFEFELGTDENRKIIYKELIEKFIPAGCPIIVSDDPSVWGAAALVAHRYPMIGVIHSSMDNGYFYLSEKYHKYLSKVVCVSERTRKNLFHRIPNNSFETSVIPCGIPIDLFSNQSSDDIDNQQINIIWTGRLEETVKRVSDIPKIAYSLKNKGVTFQIHVIGYGEYIDTLKKAIEEYELTKQIIVHGWQEMNFIIEAYKKADLLLQTSNYEGMSVAVMEALASGCGIVSSRVSGVEDYENISSAQNCIRLYEIGNIEEAVKCILDVYAIPKEKRIQAAQIFAAQEFSIESCMKQYIEICIHSKPAKTNLKLSTFKFYIQIKSKVLASLRHYKYLLTTRNF